MTNHSHKAPVPHKHKDGPAQEQKGWNASLSSMWAVNHFKELGDFLREARRLGFSRIELNHQVNSSMLVSIQTNRHLISSIHEPCPADISMADLKARDWLISSLDEQHRIQGVRSVNRSIDLAREWNVPVVIVHPGSVDINPALEDELRALYIQGQIQSPQADELRHRVRAERQRVIQGHLAATLRSLRELAEYSARAGVRLGLENRYHLFNIPFPDEMGWLLEALDPKWVGFWYDVGHAHTLDRLGFFPQETWLQGFSSRMLGVHLHDVSMLDDHFAPGLGNVDWNLVARYLPQDVIHTLEVKPHNTVRQIQSGMEMLHEHGIIQIEI